MASDATPQEGFRSSVVGERTAFRIQGTRQLLFVLDIDTFPVGRAHVSRDSEIYRYLLPGYG
jgi:hypothetical protein